MDVRWTQWTVVILLPNMCVLCSSSEWALNDPAIGNVFAFSERKGRDEPTANPILCCPGGTWNSRTKMAAAESHGAGAATGGVCSTSHNGSSWIGVRYLADAELRRPKLDSSAWWSVGFSSSLCHHPHSLLGQSSPVCRPPSSFAPSPSFLPSLKSLPTTKQGYLSAEAVHQHSWGTEAHHQLVLVLPLAPHAYC